MAKQFEDLIDELAGEAEEFSFAQCWMVKRACDLLREIIKPLPLERTHELFSLKEAITILKCRRSYKLEGKQCPGCYLQWDCDFLEKAARVAN